MPVRGELSLAFVERGSQVRLRRWTGAGSLKPAGTAQRSPLVLGSDVAIRMYFPSGDQSLARIGAHAYHQFLIPAFAIVFLKNAWG